MSIINNKPFHTFFNKTWEPKTTTPSQVKQFEQALYATDPVSAYKVRAGDNLSQIATRHGVKLEALLEANPQIRNPNLIYPGQQINLPISSTTSSIAEPVSNPEPTSPLNGNLAYADQVSPKFAQKVVEMAERLKVDPNHLMVVMHFETGGTFSPSIKNPMSSATGLIQFLPSTARSLGTSTAELATMSPERQLDFVERYLAPYAGRMNNVEDAYMAVFYPAAIGRSSNSVLFSQGSLAYQQNAGLDRNHDNQITKAEAASGVQQRLKS
jgi:spore coat assembly protein SafA